MGACSNKEDKAALVASSPKAVSVGSKGKGKGKGSKGSKGKGKGKGKININKDSKFQVELSSEWKDYGEEEDGILKRAYLVGQENAKFQLRGQKYEYNFSKRIQKNQGTGKERKIRPPQGMTAPEQPLLPPGPMIVIQVPAGGGSANKSIQIDDPNNPGKKITVAIPPHAKQGSRMAVPCPEKGEDVAAVVEKQSSQLKSGGWSRGAKMAAGMAAVGGLAVGGVVLGEHLSGGALSSWAEQSPELDAAGEWAAGALGDAGDWAAGAWDTAGDWADDAGEWAAGAADTAGDWAGDAGDWAAGAWEDAGDWASVAVDDVGDWLGTAVDDVGEYITTVF